MERYMMDKNYWNVFKDSRITNWDLWCGQPMLYDGGFYVNRTLEERNDHTRRTQMRKLSDYKKFE
jgi:hypothetical protein